MNIPSYIWQLNLDYPGADGEDGHLPLSEVWLKTHDGVTWMGRVHGYTHPARPLSSASVAHLVAIYAESGVSFVPWCVPTGEDIAKEAALACDVLAGLQQAGVPLRMAFDVEFEPTPNFWKGSPQDLLGLIGQVKDKFPNAQFTLVHYQYDQIGFDTINSVFDCFSTMDYWNDFQTSPEARLDFSFNHLAPLGKPVIYGLPGNAPTDEFVRGLDWVRTKGGRQAVIWRRGTTTAANWNVISTFRMFPDK